MDQTLITVLRYSITYYQKDLFICAQYANKHKATALHKAYWLPCFNVSVCIMTRTYHLSGNVKVIYHDMIVKCPKQKRFSKTECTLLRKTFFH